MGFTGGVFITRRDDVGATTPYDSIKWVLETHLKLPDHNWFNSAIIYGNEDSPTKIELWRSKNPDDNRPPNATYKLNPESGKYTKITAPCNAVRK